VSGEAWHLNEPGRELVIGWDSLEGLPAPILDAAKRYVALQISMRSNATASGTMTALRALANSGEAVLDEHGRFGIGWFGRLRAEGCCGTHLRRLRSFYCDSAKAHQPGFIESAAYALHTVRIGANPVGEHARRGRENRGPIRGEHLDLIVDRLFGRRGSLLDPTARAAVALCIAYFPNSGPLSLIYCHDHDEERGTLEISRHKKRRPPREAFRTRPAEEDVLAQILSEAKAAAFEKASQLRWPDGFVGVAAGRQIPLFVRDAPILRPGRSETGDDAMTIQLSAGEVARLVSDACLFLAPEAGALTPRRFRMTIPTILLQRGTPAVVVADLLDHKGGVEYVLKVYCAGGSRIVPHLDRTMADPKRRHTVALFAKAMGV
jgi:hypothetical protein